MAIASVVWTSWPRFTSPPPALWTAPPSTHLFAWYSHSIRSSINPHHHPLETLPSSRKSGIAKKCEKKWTFSASRHFFGSLAVRVTQSHRAILTLTILRPKMNDHLTNSTEFGEACCSRLTTY